MGEAESIALAIEMDADFLIIDEFMGREIAHKRGVKIVGLLGVLILAKQRGFIENVKPHVNALRAVGFRLNQKLVDLVLRKLEEE